MNHVVSQHQGKVIDKNINFSNVMAIALNPKDNYLSGVIRCITSRIGDVAVPGYVDRSELHYLNGKNLDRFVIGDKLVMKNEIEEIGELAKNGMELIGLEDPDIWIDEDTGLTHLFFTISLLHKSKKFGMIHLGHAVGENLNTLTMMPPALLGNKVFGAKDLSIAPINSHGARYCLIESADKIKKHYYSVIKLAVTNKENVLWKYGKIVFHPAKQKIPWIAEHASPGPLFSKRFIDVGEGKCLGLINGRGKETRINGQIHYGVFSVGLFIYDFENGKIDWVSPQPLIQDSEAKTITFASQIVETGKGKAIVFAHVDDAFVRSYSLKAASIKKQFNF